MKINLVFVIDESGSMYTSVDDVVGGFKSVIDEQKAIKDGSCTVSLYRFSSNVKESFLGKDINDVPQFEYNTGGMTALYDGVGTAIDNVGKWLSDMKEEDRPDKTMVVIMTDGAENNSREYSASKIKEMIKHQEEKYSWEFVYMGFDLTNINDAKTLGFKNVAVTSKMDLGNTYEVINKMSSSYRMSKSVTEATATMDAFTADLSLMTSKYEADNNIKLT